MLTVAVVPVAAGIALAAHNTRLHRDTLSHAHIVHTAAYGRDVAGKFMPDGHRKRSGRMQPFAMCRSLPQMALARTLSQALRHQPVRGSPVPENAL